MIVAVPLPVSSLSATPVQMPQTLSAASASLPSSGTQGLMHTQSTPSAQWSIPRPQIGRFPAVTVYLTSGELVLTDIMVSETLITLTFPSATAGYAVIT